MVKININALCSNSPLLNFFVSLMMYLIFSFICCISLVCVICQHGFYEALIYILSLQLNCRSCFSRALYRFLMKFLIGTRRKNFICIDFPRDRKSSSFAVSPSLNKSLIVRQILVFLLIHNLESISNCLWHTFSENTMTSTHKLRHKFHRI